MTDFRDVNKSLEKIAKVVGVGVAVVLIVGIGLGLLVSKCSASEPRFKVGDCVVSVPYPDKKNEIWIYHKILMINGDKYLTVNNLCSSPFSWNKRWCDPSFIPVWFVDKYDDKILCPKLEDHGVSIKVGTTHVVWEDKEYYEYCAGCKSQDEIVNDR